MRSYKIFLVNWNSFVEEEDPEILRRSTRGITISTKGLSKNKVCLRIVIFSLLLDGNSHPVACAWLSTSTSNQGKKAIEKINSRIGYINVCIVSEYGVQATGPYGFVLPTVDQVLQIQVMPSKKHIKDIEAEQWRKHQAQCNDDAQLKLEMSSVTYVHHASAPILNGCADHSNLSRGKYEGRDDMCDLNNSACTTEVVPRSDVVNMYAKDLVNDLFSCTVRQGTVNRSIQGFIMIAEAMGIAPKDMNAAMEEMHRTSNYSEMRLGLIFEQVDDSIISIFTNVSPAAIDSEAQEPDGDGHAEVILSRNSSMASDASADTMVHDFETMAPFQEQSNKHR
jgi:hypothetical protein